MRAIQKTLVRVLTSGAALRWRRKLAEVVRGFALRPRTVRVFLELDDPYSYLLSRYLAALRESFEISLEVYLTQALAGAYRPVPEMYAEYAVEDCRRLAAELGIPFLDVGPSPPVEHRLAMLDALAAQDDERRVGDAISRALELYWRGDSESIARRVAGLGRRGAAEAQLARNARRLRRGGHYNSATIKYGGEWYWGVDRLHYLVERLATEGARKTEKTDPRLLAISQVMAIDLPISPPTTARGLPPLEMFISFRSPYSYLATRRVMAIADAFGLELVIRPVLPMVMRQMQVPRNKLAYIVFDASREARRRGVPFGEIADPLGSGIERCHAVFSYARNERRERDYVIAVGEAIWAHGVDVSTDAGMREVADRSGLFWPEVVDAMKRDEWRDIAEENRASMMDSGCWGVPTMRIGDFVVWGQDRDWLLVRHLEEHCDSGEGILV